MTKTLSSVRLPQPNLGELPKPDIPAAVTSTTSPIRNIAGIVNYILNDSQVVGFIRILLKQVRLLLRM